MNGCASNTNADSERNSVWFIDIASFYLVQNFLAHRNRIFIVSNESKLISSNTESIVWWGEALLYGIGREFDDLVTNVIAVNVVDGLEIINV